MACSLVRQVGWGLGKEVFGGLNSVAARRHLSSSELIEKENRHNASNYSPIPVVISKGQGNE